MSTWGEKIKRLVKKNPFLSAIVGTILLIMVLGIVDAQKPNTTADPEPVATRTPIRSSPDPEPVSTPRPSPTEEPEPEPDAADLRAAGEKMLASIRSLVSHYNTDDFVHASGYVAERFISECGGDTDLAFAFAQNDQSERFDYEVHKVKVTSLSGTKAQADVTYSARDQDTGELWDDHFAIGLSFIKEGGWVLDDLFPLGVGAFC